MAKVAVFLVGISLIQVGAVFGYCPERNEDALEEGRSCRKTCTNHEQCVAKRKGCYCDSECGLSCFNKDSECEDHAEIANGRVSAQKRRFGAVAYYSCRDGFALKGRESRKCNGDKKWGGNPPTCEQNLDCEFTDPSTPVCGYTSVNWERILTTNQIGQRGYAAQSGHGHSYLVSMFLPGEWTAYEICLTFHYKLSSGRTLKVEKANGYENYWTTHGNEISSAWLNAAITIVINTRLSFQFRADGPGVLLDGITVLSDECENNCAFSPCRNGATCINRIKDYTCLCMEDYRGRYCEIDKKCPQPTKYIPNGVVVSVLVFGISLTARYECNNHHKFVGERGIVTSKVVHCVRARTSEQAEWTTNLSRLRCEAITCSSLTSLSNGRLLNPHSNWFVNNRANFECKNGYIAWNIETGAPMPTNALCKANGEWSNGSPECIRPHCTYKLSSEGILAKPVFLQKKYPVGSEIFFMCNVGYKLLGSRSLRCETMSTWSGRVPACGKIQCSHPPIIRNAYRWVNSANGYGATWRVGCRQGYFLDGRQETKCLWNGTWSAAPICSEVSQGCNDDLPAPENGKKQSHGTREITFQCNPMYRPRTEIRVYCGSDNRWHGSPPICEEVSANAFANIDGLQYLAFIEAARANYSEAQSLCRSIDGNLAVIYSETLYRDIKRLILNKIETYGLMYIGLKKFSNKRDAYEWDVENIPTDLPSYWKQTKDDRFWHFSWGDRQQECVTLRDVSHDQRAKHKWWRTGCYHKLAFFCQRNARPCRPNPCHNAGQCREEGGGDTCDCLEGFTGKHCENEVTCNFSMVLRRRFKTRNRSVYSVGEKVPLVCDEGFEIDGNLQEATCQSDGEWDIVANCRDITCGIPILPPRANIVNQQRKYEVGSTIYIGCTPYFELVGNTVLQCQRDGRWPAVNASCQMVTCNQPTLPRQAFLTQTHDSYEVGDRVEISCREGFENTGERFLQCRRDKTWDPSEASIECSEIQPETTPINSGFSKCGQGGKIGNIKKQATLDRVIGGEEAADNAWPWQALISENSSSMKQSLQKTHLVGGGSILTQKWLLTAAHVFMKFHRRDDAWLDQFVGFVGIFERPLGDQAVKNSVEAYSLDEYFRHQQFNPSTLINDIALIKLGNKLDKNLNPIEGQTGGLSFGNYIRPVCLPCTGTCFKEKHLYHEDQVPLIHDEMGSIQKCRVEEKLLHSRDAKAVVTGFGHLNITFNNRADFNLPKILQQALLRIEPEEICRQGISEINAQLALDDENNPLVMEYAESMICCKSGIPGRIVDACKGDSGGPMAREVRDKQTGESCWVQIGIVSFGYSCGLDFPGYYTNVARFIPWMNGTMGGILPGM